MGKQLGYIREGYLADILLIDGDPLADITVLQDKARILAVMKDGEFHRAPPVRARAHDHPLGRLKETTHGRHVSSPTCASSTAAAATPVPGSVLVQGNRIRQVGRSHARDVAAHGATVIDGAGATLMPGMCEAHTHFSWNDAATLGRRSRRMPLEEHVLWCAKVAKRYLEAGFTSCVGAACAKPRLDVVIRNAINAGQIPGPRYLAASQEITVPGGLGDETLPHLPFPEFSFGVNVNGADEMRKAVRMFLKYGVDSIKLNLSGDNFTPDSPAETTWMTDAEVAAAMEEVRVRGKRGTAHARSAAIGEAGAAPRHRRDLPRQLHRRRDARHARGREGPRVRRARHRDPLRDAARGRGLRHHAREGGRDGLPDRVGRRARIAEGDAQARRAHPARRRLRLRVHAALPERARPGVLRQVPRLHAGEAIRCATLYGGQIMMQPATSSAQVKEGYLADLLLVDGDPLANLAILRDPKRLLAVMKDGVFAKQPGDRGRARVGAGGVSS